MPVSPLTHYTSFNDKFIPERYEGGPSYLNLSVYRFYSVHSRVQGVSAGVRQRTPTSERCGRLGLVFNVYLFLIRYRSLSLAHCPMYVECGSAEAHSPPTADNLKLEQDSCHRTQFGGRKDSWWFARCWGLDPGPGVSLFSGALGPTHPRTNIVNIGGNCCQNS